MFTSHHSLEDHAVTDNDDDNDEFRRAFSDARPLRVEERVPETKPKPKPRARFSKADERQALQESLRDDIDTIEHGYGASLSFQRASVGRRTMRKLARGGFSVRAEIDLHGMTVAEAKQRLGDFIDYSVITGNLCVRIVHGKGLGSGTRGPVLKNAVNRWLRKWDSVLAFVSTPQVDGGTGALYVLLQRV
jgi:DNA-nicking Smr family endonuclease